MLFRQVIWTLSSLAVFGFQYTYTAKGKQFSLFYISKASGLKDLSCDKLTEALLTDKALLPQIV
jgi:hypothetical protein